MPSIYKSEKTGRIYEGFTLAEAKANCEKEESQRIVINESFAKPAESNIKVGKKR